MLNTLITHLQIFGIGVTYGIAGPCLVLCTPILLAYVAGSGKAWRDCLKDIAAFLTGKFLAYLILSAIAGFSSTILNKFVGSGLTPLFTPLAAVTSIILGTFIIFNKTGDHCHCHHGAHSIHGGGGLFLLGFFIGITPCAPLLALLMEITLISHNAFEGMLYGFSFGMGTIVSGLFVTGVLAGIFRKVPAMIFRSEKNLSVFRVACGALLIIFGIWLLAGHV